MSDVARENGNAYAFGKSNYRAPHLSGVRARDAASKVIFKKLL
jgi:hypothetical protein